MLDQDSELSAKEVGLRLKVDLLLDLRGRKDIVAHANIVVKEALKLLGLGRGAEDLIFLEGL